MDERPWPEKITVTPTIPCAVPTLVSMIVVAGMVGAALLWKRR